MMIMCHFHFLFTFKNCWVKGLRPRKVCRHTMQSRFWIKCQLIFQYLCERHTSWVINLNLMAKRNIWMGYNSVNWLLFPSLMTTKDSWVEHLLHQHWISQWQDSMDHWAAMLPQDTHLCQWWHLCNSTTHHLTTTITWPTIWRQDSRVHPREGHKDRGLNRDRVRAIRVATKDRLSGLGQIEWQ